MVFLEGDQKFWEDKEEENCRNTKIKLRLVILEPPYGVFGGELIYGGIPLHS